MDGGLGDNVGVETVAEIDRVDVVTAHVKSVPALGESSAPRCDAIDGGRFRGEGRRTIPSRCT